MPNVARQQLGLQSEKLRNVNKNEHFPSHDLHIGQEVMYQDVLLLVYVCSQEVTI